MGICQLEKRERKVVPGRGMEVGTCVVYFGSCESLGMLGWWGKRLEMRLGQVRTGFECQVKELQIYYVVGTSLSAQLNSLI